MCFGEGKKNKISQISNFRCDDALLQSSSSSSSPLLTIDSIPFRFTFYSSFTSFDRHHHHSKEDKEEENNNNNNNNLCVFLPLLTPPFVSTVDRTRTRVRTRTRPRRRSPCLFSALSLLSCCCCWCCCSLCF